ISVPLANAQLVVASPQPGALFSRGTAASGPVSTQTFVPAVFQEGSAHAFKTKTDESGFMSPADTATRLLVRITNVPATVQVFAPVAPNQGARAQLISADANGIGGTAIAGTGRAGGTYSQIAINNGTGTATWEVTMADAATFETLTFRLLVEN